MWHAFFDLPNGLLNAQTRSGKTFALWIPAAVNAASAKRTKKNRLKYFGSRRFGLWPMICDWH